MVRGRAHHAAGPGGGRQPALDLRDPLLGHRAGAILRPVAPAIRARRQPLALERSRQHRPRHQLHRRHIRRRRCHQLRRHRLVAAADQHRRIHRLGGQHRLGIQRRQVPVMHGRRKQRRLAQGHRRERHRQTAGGQHAALHRLDQLRHRAVAVVVGRTGIDDPHHRPVQHRLRVAHRFREGPAQIQREILVAVVGGVARQPAFGGMIGHATMLARYNAQGEDAVANMAWVSFRHFTSRPTPDIAMTVARAISAARVVTAPTPAVWDDVVRHTAVFTGERRSGRH